MTYALLPILSRAPPPQFANNRTERNSMVPQAGFRDTSEGQAVLQGQLRRFRD